LDKKKFGGQGRLKQSCLQKRCENLSKVSNESGMATKIYADSNIEVEQDMVPQGAVIRTLQQVETSIRPLQAFSASCVHERYATNIHGDM